MCSRNSRSLAKTLRVFGLTLAALFAFAAVAAGSASALTWSNPGATFPMVKEGDLLFQGGGYGETMVCAGMGGAGNFTTGSGGPAAITFSKCTDSFGLQCTTSGSPAGTI